MADGKQESEEWLETKISILELLVSFLLLSPLSKDLIIWPNIIHFSLCHPCFVLSPTKL